MVVAVTVITLVTLGAAFAVISVVVTRSQEHHLDAALLRAAHEEAKTIARLDATALAISQPPRPGRQRRRAADAATAPIYDRAGKVKRRDPRLRRRARRS